MTSSCANDPPFDKVEDLAQLVKGLVAHWLGALTEVAGSNPGESMKIFVQNSSLQGMWLMIKVCTWLFFHALLIINARSDWLRYT